MGSTLAALQTRLLIGMLREIFQSRPVTDHPGIDVAFDGENVRKSG
jgi:hypothetical protein